MCGTATPEQLIRAAMVLATEAAGRGDPPFGALLVSPLGEVLVTASNRQVSANDPTAHGEIELLRAAARAGFRPPLGGYSVAVNAEPCSMCASALVKAGISALVYGAPHEPHLDPDLGITDVFARRVARRTSPPAPWARKPPPRSPRSAGRHEQSTDLALARFRTCYAAVAGLDRRPPWVPFPRRSSRCWRRRSSES